MFWNWYNFNIYCWADTIGNGNTWNLRKYGEKRTILAVFHCTTAEWKVLLFIKVWRYFELFMFSLSNDILYIIILGLGNPLAVSIPTKVIIIILHSILYINKLIFYIVAENHVSKFIPSSYICV